MTISETAHSNAQQAARHMQVYNGNPRTHGRDTRDDRGHWRDAGRPPPLKVLLAINSRKTNPSDARPKYLRRLNANYERTHRQ